VIRFSHFDESHYRVSILNLYKNQSINQSIAFAGFDSRLQFSTKERERVQERERGLKRFSLPPVEHSAVFHSIVSSLSQSIPQFSTP